MGQPVYLFTKQPHTLLVCKYSANEVQIKTPVSDLTGTNLKHDQILEVGDVADLEASGYLLELPFTSEYFSEEGYSVHVKEHLDSVRSTIRNSVSPVPMTTYAAENMYIGINDLKEALFQFERTKELGHYNILETLDISAKTHRVLRLEKSNKGVMLVIPKEFLRE